MLLIAARFFQFSAACALFGGGFFDLWCQFRTGRGIRPAVPFWSLLLIASSLAGLWAITATITDAPPTPDAIAAVLTGTGIGHVWIFRFAVMMILLPAAWAPRLRFVPALLGGVLLGSLAWAGHGAMNEGWGGAIHLAADVGHLLGAGLWLGALPVLLVLLNRDLVHAQAVLGGFAVIGTTAVGLLGASGLVNAWFLVGPNHIVDLTATAYGRLLIAKLGLFAAMLALASLNRWILTPALLRDGPAHLRLAIGTELACGALVLAAVAWMGTLVPAIST